MVLVGMKDDKPLSVKLFTKNGTEFLSPTQVVQAQPTAIGMDTTIVVFDDSTIRDGCKAVRTSQNRNPAKVSPIPGGVFVGRTKPPSTVFGTLAILEPVIPEKSSRLNTAWRHSGTAKVDEADFVAGPVFRSQWLRSPRPGLSAWQ